MASWTKPSGDCYKLNVKGLVTDGGTTCTFGGVFRNGHGGWITGCGGKINVRCGDDEAEFLAAEHCLRTVFYRGNHYVELEVESRSAVRAMKRPQVGLVNPLLRLVKYVMSWNWGQLDVTAIEASANGLAFELASYCQRLTPADGLIIFDVPPAAVRGTYEEEHDFVSDDGEGDHDDVGHGGEDDEDDDAHDGGDDEDDDDDAGDDDDDQGDDGGDGGDEGHDSN